MPQPQGRICCQQPGPQQVSQHRGGQNPSGREQQKALGSQSDKRQNAQEQERVVDQNDGDIDVQAAYREADGTYHERPEGDATAGSSERGSLEGLLLAGGQGQ